MLADDVVQQVLRALNEPDLLDPFDDLEPSYEFDPVARITADEPDTPQVLPFQVGEQDSTVDVTTATAQERRQARRTYRQQTPGSSAGFQAAQAATMPKPKAWFAAVGGGPNGDLSGFIPRNKLAAIEKGVHFMRPDAAKAYKAMQRAMKKDLGIGFSVTDSYRTYDQQVELKARKGDLAATPGHSNHGWGLALDVNVNDSRVYNWLKSNGKRYGFEQPMSYEPWHWEYGGGYKPVSKPARRGRRPQPSTQMDPLNRLDSVSSLASASMVFGSVMGEVQGPSPVTKTEWNEHQKSGGLGFVPKKYRDIIREAGERYGVSPRLLGFVAKHESGFNPKAVSSAGAQGLFQIMPLHGLENPFNVRENAMAGARVLASYMDGLGLRKGLAAYNAGPGNWRAGLDYADAILDEFLGRV